VKSEVPAAGQSSGRLFSAHQVAWNEYLERVKWCKVPKTYLDHVTRVCSSALQLNVVMHVLFATVGSRQNRAGEQPEWCQVAMSKLASQYGATINGVAGAISKVVEAGILEGRAVGRGKEYRVLFENWNASLKTIELDDPETDDGDSDEDDPAVTEVQTPAVLGKPLVVARGKSSPWLALSEPASKARIENRSGAAIDVNHEIVDGALRITISDASSSLAMGEQEANDLTSGVGTSTVEQTVCDLPTPLVRFGPQPVDSSEFSNSVDQLSRELTELLTATLTKKLQSPPPPTMVRAAAMRLLGAELGLREFSLTLAAKENRFKTWGFLASVVQDCLNANKDLPRPSLTSPIDEQRVEEARMLTLEYEEYRLEQARAIVESMDEARRAALSRQASLQLKAEARWERMTAAQRQSEVRRQLIHQHKDAPQIADFDTWREARAQQIAQALSEEAHRA
jgi:hypothetical protein